MSSFFTKLVKLFVSISAGIKTVKGGEHMKETKYILTFGKKYNLMPHMSLMRRFYEHTKNNRSYFAYMLFVGFIRYFNLEKADDETIASYIQAWYGGFLNDRPQMVKAKAVRSDQEEVIVSEEEKPVIEEDSKNEEDNIFSSGGIFDMNSFKVK